MTPKQEHRIRTELLPALLSGTYEQAQSSLRRGIDNPSYCCLGVACDLYDATRWRSPGTEVTAGMTDTWRDCASAVWITAPGEVDTYEDAVKRRMGESSTLPQEVQDYFGFTDVGAWRYIGDTGRIPAGEPYHVRDYRSLVEMNDSGESFDDIAETIEYILDHPDRAMFSRRSEIAMVTP